MKWKLSFSFVTALFLAYLSAAFGATDDGNSPSSVSQPTIVSLIQNVNNAIQLGVQINGQFTYPFIFTADPQPTNGITTSSTGLISGTPSQAADQNVRITVKDSNGKLVGTYPIVLHVTNALTVILGSGGNSPLHSANDSPPVNEKTKLAVNPVYEGGDTVSGNSGTAKSIVKISCNPIPAAEGVFKCDPDSSTRVVTDDKGSFSYQLNTPLYKGDQISVSTGSNDLQKVLVQRAPKFLGEEMRAIIGYQQTGASSSDFVQNWFLDFYISRPLAFQRKTEGDHVKWRWWGNVRVASFPQPGNQSLADLASDLPKQIGTLKLNQLAQGAEFLSGLEFKPWKSFPFRGFSENTRQVFSLGFIAGFGATGFFSSPSNNAQVFQTPASGSSQLPIFQKAFPGVTTANVGFISPDVERFPKQHLVGFRLTTNYIDPSGMPLTSDPAMLAFTVGQNQAISGGQLRGVIGRVEAFYPLPFGNRGQTIAGAFSSLYLFGTAQMRLGATRTAPLLALKPVNIAPSDPSVTLVSLPNTRDEYRLGFGVDMVGLVSALTGGSAKKNTTTAAPPKSDNSSRSPTSGTNATAPKQ